jgi:Domain of unknown function (DUF4190)
MLSREKPVSTGVASASYAAGTVGVGKAVGPIKRSGEATASLILGLFSFIPIVGLLAVIFGHLARASIRRSGGKLLGEGMAVFGILLGYWSLAGWSIYLIVAVIVPSLPPSRAEANEMSAVGSLRAISTSETTYASSYVGGYSPDLASLGLPKAGMEHNAQAAGLIDDMLASGTKFGYRFTYAAGKKEDGRIDTYTVHADPITPGETGKRFFFIDESGVIRQERDKEANAYSPPLTEK